jgi:glycosyltransferase involved in cell wall biosynthesis
MNGSISPQRVLMTADTVGGVWQYALDLARALASNGIEITLATLGRQPSVRQQREAEAIPSLAIRSSSFKLEWMPDAWDDVQESGDWLLEIEDSITPDIVHLNGLCHGSLPWSAPVLMVAHSCVLSWWDSVRQAPIPPEWAQYRYEAKRGLHAADRVVAPSRSMASSIERLYDIDAVGVIPNGRNTSVGYAPTTAKQPLILAAGRLWDEAKNLATLDRACAGLQWPVYLAGPTHGPFENIFIPENAVALGALSPRELATWMRQASIYAFPAKYEPFGLSVLEAALCGCALVLGDIPSLRENWDGAALFAPPNDEGALRAALDALIAAPALQSELGAKALARASQFTVERMAAGYLSAYAQLLELPRAATTRLAAGA